jgi:hypothetical protein
VPDLPGGDGARQVMLILLAFLDFWQSTHTLTHTQAIGQRSLSAARKLRTAYAHCSPGVSMSPAGPESLECTAGQNSWSQDGSQDCPYCPAPWSDRRTVHRRWMRRYGARATSTAIAGVLLHSGCRARISPAAQGWQS